MGKIWDRINSAVFKKSEQPSPRTPVIRLQESTPIIHIKNEGNTGTDITAGILSEEYLTELQGIDAADLYDKMRRSDPVLKMCIMAVTNPIKNGTWDVQTVDDTPESEKQADLVRHCLLNSRDKRWKTFLHEILTMVIFGYALFERKHKVVTDDPKFGTFIGYASFGWRSPRTIERWNTDENENLESVEQDSFGDNQRPNKMDARFLSLFTLDREGTNFEGISMLRTAYGAWLRKRTYQKLNAVGTEKFAVPTPMLEVPEGQESGDQIENAKAILRAYTSHQTNFITFPTGWNLTLFGNDYDPSKVQNSISAENSEMVNAFMANFLLLGQTGSGSYALSTDLSDFFLGGIEYMAELICEVFNDQIIPELIKLNFGPQADYPKMTCTGITDKAGKELAEILTSLAGSKHIIPDQVLEDHLRKRYNLPEASEETQRKPEPVAPSPGFGNPGSENTGHLDDDGNENSSHKDNPKNGKNPDPEKNADDIPNEEDDDVAKLSESIKFADPPRKQITNDTKRMRELMEENVLKMGNTLTEDIMRKLKKTTESTRLTAINDQKVKGTAAYKTELLAALTNMSIQALTRARSEIPAKKNVKLAHLPSNLKDLPKSIQKQLKAESDLIVTTQGSDMEKALFFQFRSSMDQPDPMVQADLFEKSEKQSTSPSVIAAAGNTTARVINESRNAFFFDDDVLEGISAFKFNNPKDERSSAICFNLANRIFRKDDPRSSEFFPPLHHNCRSFLSTFDIDEKPKISEVGLRPVGDEKEIAKALKSITLSDK